MQSTFNAIVIGAGPAGCTAALLLARAGWSVALVEKHSFPRRKVCGECIAASNLPLLAALGIADRLHLEAGAPLRQVALMHGSTQVIADLPAKGHKDYVWGRALGRETLDTLLLEQARLEGVHVFQPWAVQQIRGSPGDWLCDMREVASGADRVLKAPIAIDAHGSWGALGVAGSHPRRRHKAGDLFAFKANFRNAAQPRELLTVLALQGGYGGMVTAGGDMTTVACCIRRDQLMHWRTLLPGKRAGEVVETVLKDQCTGVRVALQNATRLGPWLGAGPLDTGIHLRPHDSIFRIGNVAGEAHPIIGEGISMALQSAWLLCEQLLQTHRDADPAVSQPRIAMLYEQQWRRHFAPRLRIAAGFAHLAMRPALTPLMLATVKRWPLLLTTGARWSAKSRSAVDPAQIQAHFAAWGKEPASTLWPPLE